MAKTKVKKSKQKKESTSFEAAGLEFLVRENKKDILYAKQVWLKNRLPGQQFTPREFVDWLVRNGVTRIGAALFVKLASA